MLRVIILTAVGIFAYLYFSAWKKAGPQERKTLVVQTLLGALAALLLFMAVTGRIHVLFALVAAVIPFLRKLAVLARILPMFRSWLDQMNASAKKQEPPGSAPIHSGAGLSVDEALKVLGLEKTASREEVIAAHRRLIQKFHPDRGGTNHLAHVINEAKEVVLKWLAGH